jgi:hypothetical protein
VKNQRFSPKIAFRGRNFDYVPWRG